jgi:hypothetical protein
MIKYQLDITLYEKISLSRDLSVKGGTSERCYRTRRGRTDEQRYAIISPYFDGRIKMNGPYPEITNISFLAKLFLKTFMSLIKARLHGGRTDIILWFFEDGWKFANENTSIKYM